MSECRCAAMNQHECLCGAFDDTQRVSLQEWTRMRSFLIDLTDPEKYAHALRDQEIVRRALELLELFK